MMDSQEIWDLILSREPHLIRSAYRILTVEEKQSLTIHLKKMANENGWHAEQIQSAVIALNVIEGKTT